MNPTALRTFTNNDIWVFHDGMPAVVLAAILVTHRKPAHASDAGRDGHAVPDNAKKCATNTALFD
jgi:hypothetical protein